MKSTQIAITVYNYSAVFLLGLDPINNVLLHHKMAKEVSDPQSFFRDLIELQHLESLSLTLPVQACRILMATITESMPNCQNLTLLVGKYTIYRYLLKGLAQV